MAKITKKPSLGVSKLGAPSRSDYNMNASWTVPSGLTSSKKKDRATSIKVDWMAGASDGVKSLTVSGGTGLRSSGLNLNGFRVGNTTYNRASFYPNAFRKLNYVTIRVTPRNGKGLGKSQSTTTRFYAPRTPQLSDPVFNNENGNVSLTVTTDAGTDLLERYDTKYAVTVTSPFLNDGEPTNTSDSASTSTEFSIDYDAEDYMNLDQDTQFIKVMFSAYARGFAGDSETVTRTLYVSYPAQATIIGVDVSSRDSTGKCTVHISTNATTEHPVDKVKLEYAADVEYDDPNDIPASDWNSTDIIDNDKCTALSVPVGALIPSRGNHTWVRVASYHLNEAVLYRYSQPVLVEALETPATPAGDIKIDILDAKAGVDGKSAVALLGWNKDGRDDFTGTELTWDESEDTWKSTEQPKKHEFTWSDGELEYEGETYHDSALITIKGLSEGSKYFIKARRYLDADNEEFSAYSNTATVFTSEAPESIVATAVRYIADGNPLSVYWTFAGNGLQVEWQIVRSDGVIILEGKGGAGSAQISAERLKELVIDGSMTFTVRASTGSGFVESEQHVVSIIEQPTLSITAPSVMTAQPYSFEAEASTLCDLYVIVTSNGATGQFPQGVASQVSGDTIHSDVYSPIWEDGSATITLPSGLNFWDGGRYAMSVYAVDRTTGLKSNEVSADFSVAWAHQAVSPELVEYVSSSDTEVDEDKAYYINNGSDYEPITPIGDENPSEEGWYEQAVTEFVTLTVIDTVDSDGDHTQAVQIELTPPTGCAETDVYDIYRMDVEKPSLIGQGFPLTHATIDEYAPFGDADLRYRVALRTIDGDVEFVDFEYEAPCENIRFDWAGGSLELHYGNSIGESFEKTSEIRRHIDGGIDGYWNQNVLRRSSLNSSIIKIIKPRDIEQVRLLAKHTNAVFVRLPNGAAFEADVQVTDLSVKNEAVTAVAFDVTEVDLTQEFLLPIPFVLQEE